METPSSTRRVTRSQASVITNNILMSSVEKGLSNSRTARKGKQQQQSQQDRSVLFDITNDSPIVGLAANLETPLSKSRSCLATVKRTPGSGEALLRGQVKTLLQKVEEEAELSKLSLETRSFVVHSIKGFVNSPAGLLAPTPANTPQVPTLLGSNVSVSLAPSPLIEETIISQVIDEVKEPEESLELQKSIITRSLLLDFSEKSDSCDSLSDCSSVLAYEGVTMSADDDNASVWSVQVNTSTQEEDEEEDEFEDEEAEEDYFYDGAEEEGCDDSELVDELSEFISKISMNEKKVVPRFEGMHTRFVYDSDDEKIVDKEEEKYSPNILRLNGLPTPKGKHVRFSE